MTVTAHPARLEAGGETAAVLEIAARSEAAVSVWTSSGSASAPEPAGPGRFRVRFQAGPERFPRVVLVQVTARRDGRDEHGWLALPVFGRDTLALQTKPSSRVEVRIGGATFGPVRSSAAGRARIPVLVPPGIRTATVQVRDSFGNETETAFDLRPPAFRRVRVLASAPSASWADAAPVWLEIFAVDPLGRPARRAELSVAATRGELGPADERAPGVFFIPFRAPARAAGADARIEARLPGPDAAADARTIAIAPGPAARIALKASPPAASPQGRVRIEGAVLDARDNELPEEPLVFRTDFGAVTGLSPRAAELRVPASFGGREQAHLVARARDLEVDLPIPLVAGTPAALQVRFAEAQIRANQEVEATVLVADAAGNPVSGALPRFAAVGASLQPARELGAGRYAVLLRALPESAPAAELRVTAGTAQLSSRILVVAAAQRAFGLAAGTWLFAQHNLGRAGAGGFELELAGQSPSPGLELFGRAVALRFAPATVPIDGSAVQRASLEAFGAQAGARVVWPLGSRWSVHTGGAAGLLRALGTLRIQGGPANGIAEPTARWVPSLSAAGGGSLRLGHSRFVVETAFTAAPSSGAVRGNLGGLSLRAGWLIDLT